MYKIICHPGTAHKDDFLSVCVLLTTLKEAEVFRCEPTLADLDDANTFIVDVGMEYDPGRRNFDHHQDPKLPCAFHLIMKYLDLHEAAAQVFAWYPHMSMIDVRGPHRTAEYLGVETSLFFATSSPIDGYILSIFAQVEVLRGNELLYQFMKDLGTDMLALIEHKMLRLAELKAEAKVIPVKQFKVVFSEFNNTPKLAMEMYLRYLDDEQIVMSITPSNRGEGWEMIRLGDNTMVDFRAIETCPEIGFVHGSGFLATTHTRLPIHELLELAGRSITASPQLISYS